MGMHAGGGEGGGGASCIQGPASLQTDRDNVTGAHLTGDDKANRPSHNLISY